MTSPAEDKDATMGALAVIDDALEQGRVTATNSEERELQELALAIQADSPEPDPAFAATLVERVSAGFPQEPSPVAEGGRRAAERARGTLRSAAGRLSGLTPRLTPRYAGGVAAVVFALAVGGGIISQTVGTGDQSVMSVSSPPSAPVPETGPAEPAIAPMPDIGRGGSRDEYIPSAGQGGNAGGGGGGNDAGSFSAPGVAADSAAPEEMASKAIKSRDTLSKLAPSSAPAEIEGGNRSDSLVIDPVDPGFPGGGPKQNESLSQQDRQVERSAYITIGAPEDKLADAARGVADTARRHGGFVLSSSMTVGEKTSGGGQFELRVPVDQLDATLDDLSDLGEVRSMTQDEQDVTSTFESLEDEVKAAEAERKSLLTRLENADTDLEAQAIRRQLKQANRKLNGLKADQGQLAKRVSYAAVSVTLQQGKSGAGGATAQAFDDALAILTASFGIFLRIIAVLIPLGIVAAVVWLVVSGARRRRRESALD